MDSWWPNGVVFPPQPKSAILDYQRPSCRQTSGRVVRRVRPERHSPAPVQEDRSVSLLRVVLWVIFGINICLHHASRWTRMVRGGLPGTIQKFHLAQFLENNTTPIPRRPDRPQSALAFTAVLIAEHARLSPAIAP